MAVDVVALVLPEAHLFALWALSIHLLLHWWSLWLIVVTAWCFHLLRIGLLLLLFNFVIAIIVDWRWLLIGATGLSDRGRSGWWALALSAYRRSRIEGLYCFITPNYFGLIAYWAGHLEYLPILIIMSDFRFSDGWLWLFTIVISLLISGGGRCWFIAFATLNLQSTQYNSHYLVLSHGE